MQLNMNENKRPTMLTILCVFSFIGSGAASVSNFFIYFNYELVADTIKSTDFSTMGFDPSFFTGIDKSYFLLAALLSVLSFTGVRHMWALRKAGFHLYAISQLLLLILSTIYIYRPTAVFPMLDLLTASIFILMYLRFRDIMN